MNKKTFVLDEEEIKMLLQCIMYFGSAQWGEEFYESQKKWLAHYTKSESEGIEEVGEIMKFVGLIREEGETREFDVQKFMTLYTRLSLPVLDGFKPDFPKLEDLPRLNVSSNEINEEWILENILGIKKKEKENDEE